MRQKAKNELDQHLATGRALDAARVILREHVDGKSGKPSTDEEELEVEAVSHLRDAIDYLEQGKFELAMHHAWRAQVAMAKRGRCAGVECLDEQSVQQCIEMCRVHDEQRAMAVADVERTQKERDQHQARAFRAEQKLRRYEP